MPVRDYKPQAQKTRFEKLMQSFAQTRLGGKLFITVFPAIDRRLMPLTRGRLSTGLGQPIVLLHVRGARSGVERTVPLLATKTGDTVLVVASKAGATKHPAWYHNVRANPEVEVTVDGQRQPMRGDIATEGRGTQQAVGASSATTTTALRRHVGAGPEARVIPVVALRPR